MQVRLLQLRLRFIIPTIALGGHKIYCKVLENNLCACFPACVPDCKKSSTEMPVMAERTRREEIILTIGCKDRSGIKSYT